MCSPEKMMLLYTEKVLFSFPESFCIILEDYEHEGMRKFIENNYTLTFS